MWNDIDLKLRKQQDGDILVMTEEDAIINSLQNICSTLQGSRRMLPDFALPIFNLLFEPMDEETAYTLGNLMLNSITKWDDRIEVTTLHVNANYDLQQYEVALSFKLKQSVSQEQTFTFILKQQG